MDGIELGCISIALLLIGVEYRKYKTNHEKYCK